MPQYLPKEVKDLLSKMLVVNPAQRISLAGIMQHPWFLSNSMSVTYTPSSILEDHVIFLFVPIIHDGRALPFVSLKLTKNCSRLWSLWAWVPSRIFSFA